MKISADVRLSSNELANNLKLFPNGFYIDGFVYLSSDTSVDLSIPFSGFYGDWEKRTAFDTTLYDSSAEQAFAQRCAEIHRYIYRREKY